MEKLLVREVTIVPEKKYKIKWFIYNAWNQPQENFLLKGRLAQFWK